MDKTNLDSILLTRVLKSDQALGEGFHFRVGDDDWERNDDPVDGEEGPGGRVRPVAVLARHRHVEDGHHGRKDSVQTHEPCDLDRMLLPGGEVLRCRWAPLKVGKLSWRVLPGQLDELRERVDL